MNFPGTAVITTHSTTPVRDEQQGHLVPIDDITSDLHGKYCIVKYDDQPYPGIIQDSSDSEVEVKVMHQIGDNRFFWPGLEDKQVDKLIWKAVLDHLDLYYTCSLNS